MPNVPFREVHRTGPPCHSPLVASAKEKGQFSTSIADDVISEALKSVAKRTGDPAPGNGAAEPGPNQLAANEVTVEVEADVPAGEAVAAEPIPAELTPEQKQIEELQAQLDFSLAKGRETMEKLREGHEKMLRAVADLENYRKRAVKEKEEVQRFGTERLLKDFLPIIDNLERALDHGRTPADFNSLVQGIKMTRKLFEDTLTKHGVKAFSSIGKAFDPRFHEAMQHVETAEHPPGHVVMEVLKGYTLNDRLVRPALVGVAKTPAAQAGAQPAASEAPGSAGTDQGPPLPTGEGSGA